MLFERKYVTVKYSKSGLEKRNRDLSALAELSNLLSSTLDLETLLGGALSLVIKHFNFDSGRIYLMEPDAPQLTLAAHSGIDIAGLERLHIDEGFSGKAARTRSFIAQHVSELADQERRHLLEQKGLVCIVCVPLIIMDRVKGVINLASKTIISLDETKIDMLMAMGHQIGVAASHAQVYQDLMRKLAQIQKKEETIKLFAYSVSHDLKSPLIGLYGLTRRLHNFYGPRLDEKGRRYCEQILKAAIQVMNLVDQMNAFITAREVPLRIERVSMQRVAAEIRDEFADKLGNRQVKWSEPAFLPEIMADEMRMARVFRNLVDNALKYGGEQLSEIRIGYAERERHHVFSVGDDGVGIAENSEQRLFKMFQREETSRGIEGSGLGLTIVREIAQAHQGDVWVESGPGPGTVFYVSIAKDLEPAHSNVWDVDSATAG